MHVFISVAFIMTIVVATFRYCALKYPIRANRYIYKTRLAVIASIGVWVIVPIICIPVFLISEVGILDY